MKLGQNVCLVEILDKFDNGSLSDQKLGQILEKPLGHIFIPIMILSQNVCLDEI